jgi:uncharacterized protein YodC (DUF2158 family)
MPQTVFNVGDVVRLKSGGPKMTVTNITTATVQGEQVVTIHCTWFYENRAMSDGFRSGTLKDASADAT